MALLVQEYQVMPSFAFLIAKEMRTSSVFLQLALSNKVPVLC